MNNYSVGMGKIYKAAAHRKRKSLMEWFLLSGMNKILNMEQSHFSYQIGTHL